MELLIKAWPSLLLMVCMHSSCSRNTSKPPATFSDTVIVDIPAAVFYSPDSLQLQKIKAVNDAAVFESMVHESFYQMKNAENVLQASFPAIKIIKTRNARYILFKRKNGQQECVDLNNKNDPFGILVFNAEKPARSTDMSNIETELGFYFGR
jgi:hypothetical protein